MHSLSGKFDKDFCVSLFFGFSVVSLNVCECVWPFRSIPVTLCALVRMQVCGAGSIDRPASAHTHTA